MRDRRGVAALEFALLVPLLILLYTGFVDVSQAISIKRMTTLSASTVANLATQYASISDSNTMPDILRAASAVLTPYPIANAVVRVTCITIDDAGKATVSWSRALNGTALDPGVSIRLPAGFAAPNTTVILGETTYAFKPILDPINFGTFDLASSVYMFPRSPSGTVALAP